MSMYSSNMLNGTHWQNLHDQMVSSGENMVTECKRVVPMFIVCLMFAHHLNPAMRTAHSALTFCLVLSPCLLIWSYAIRIYLV